MTTDILRRKDVEARVGLSRSTIYELMARRAFPLPIKLSQQRVGWLAHEVDAFVQARIAARDREAA